MLRKSESRQILHFLIPEHEVYVGKLRALAPPKKPRLIFYKFYIHSKYAFFFFFINNKKTKNFTVETAQMMRKAGRAPAARNVSRELQ